MALSSRRIVYIERFVNKNALYCKVGCMIITLLFNPFCLSHGSITGFDTLTCCKLSNKQTKLKQNIENILDATG